MRLAKWRDQEGQHWVGSLGREHAIPIARCGSDSSAELLDIAMGTRTSDPIADPVPLSSVKLTAPIPQPGTIRDFYTFEEHVRIGRARRGLEMDPVWYELPAFYFTSPYVVRDHLEEIHVPASQEVDYELEVAAVLGRGGSNLTHEQAVESIAGYTIFNDWSARDIQRREMTLGLGPGKGKDFAHSLGPVLTTAASMPGEPGRPSAEMLARVNGEPYSRGQLSGMYHSFADAIVYASRDAVVRPGDIIASGTVGTGCILELSSTHGSDAYPWLIDGDEVELEVEGIGVLSNTVRFGQRL